MDSEALKLVGRGVNYLLKDTSLHDPFLTIAYYFRDQPKVTQRPYRSVDLISPFTNHHNPSIFQEEHEFFLNAFELISSHLNNMKNLLTQYKEQLVLYRDSESGYLNWKAIEPLKAHSYTRAVRQTRHFLNIVFQKLEKDQEVDVLRSNLRTLIKLVVAIKDTRRKPLGRGRDQKVIQSHKFAFELWVEMHDFLFKWNQKLPEEPSCTIM